jgi:uncharacterized protein (TIGR02271 family)
MCSPPPFLTPRHPTIRVSQRQNRKGTSEMDLKGKLRKGLRIFGADNREYGTVDRYDEQYAYVGERKIPVTAFERMDNDRLYLGAQGSRYFDAKTETLGEAGQIRVPVVEERLNVEKRQGEMGSVDIRKDVTTEQVHIPVELRHEEVTVDRVDVKDRPVAAGDRDAAFEEGTIRVPVRGEEAVVEKEAFVTGEVVIDREVKTERQTVSDTVRKQRVDVDENYKRDRSAFEEHFKTRRGTAADKRTFADAEPNYRKGYETAHDERYAGRDFAAVEPELRKSHTGNESWEHLREEIREGFDRGRRR